MTMRNLIAFQAADAIVHLINSSPRTPSKTQIADVLLNCGWCDATAQNGELAAEIRLAMAREDAAIAACGNLLGPAFDRAAALASKRSDELRTLVARLPSPPRTLRDIALLAEIAFHHADRDRSGRMLELVSDDGFRASAARLIQAVLQFVEARHA